MSDYCLTEESQKRIDLIHRLTSASIPVLLIGPTGTGKTASAEYALKNDKIIKFNFSSETTIDQLIGYPTIDESSSSGIAYHKGPFTEAYENGYSLILDEFNLAHEDVLQCIEGALDSGILTIEDPTRENNVITMHSNFKLVATQNEAIDEFAKKRNKLTTKLMSRFTAVWFNHLSEEDLLFIARSFHNKYLTDSDIEHLIEFHNEWTYNAPENSIIFTIRNLKNTVASVSNDVSLYKAVLYNYGSSYNEKDLEILKKFMIQNQIFPDYNLVQNDFSSFQHCVPNKVLNEVMDKILFFSSQDQAILLVGNDGCGKTQIAKWASSIISPNGMNMMVCTPETTISDLIGNYVPASIGDNAIQKDLPVKWIDGPIIRSIIEQKCVFLDQIECAQPQVIERINSLFDAYANKKYGIEPIFGVEERPINSDISIKDGFKFIATASLKDLKKLSPAMLNRFAVIYVGSQFSDSKKDYFQELIHVISPSLDQFVKSQNKFSQKLKEIFNDYLNNKCSLEIFVKITHGLEILHKIYESFDILQLLYTLVDIYINKRTPNLPNKWIFDLLQNVNDTNYFHFRGNPEISNIIALIVLLQHIKQHFIMQSTTGLGKTSAAMMIAEQLKKKAYKVSFNSETKIIDLFGNLTITNGTFNNSNGQLYSAMKEGGFFIADELNLSETSIMESLTTALEQSGGETINLPNGEEPITVHKDFLFIGCQNDTTMYGRKHLPFNILKKVVVLEYPYPKKHLEEVIASIFKEIPGPHQAVTHGVYLLMNQLKSHQKFSAFPWSFRDVRRFMKRCAYFDNTRILSTISFSVAPAYIHAAFMLLSSARNQENIIPDIIELIKNSFFTDLQALESNENQLRRALLSPVIVKIQNDKIYLQKGPLLIRCTVKIPVDQDVRSFWESMFLACLVPPDEPLLICGPSGYKTFLATQIANSTRVVSLNRDSTTSSLIGNVALVDHNSYTSFLFDILITIANNHPNIFSTLSDMKKVFKGTNENFLELEEQIDIMKTKIPTLSFIIQNIYENIQNNFSPNKSNSIMKNYTTAFKPGLITSQVLQQRILILKNFAKPAVAVMERFNELFSVEPELTLIEDYTNTIVPSNNNVIHFKNSTFRVIATCDENDINHLSEAMLSRLNVVSVSKYNKNDITKILGNYYIENRFKEMNFMSSEKVFTIAKAIEKNMKDFGSIISPAQAIEEAFHLLSNKDFTNNQYESPLIINDTIVTSKFSNLKAHTRLLNPPQTNLIFTPSIQVMVDRIFEAFAINKPIILQGPNGNGKSMAVMYTAKCFGINPNDIITIQLSRATTVENLYGQNGIVEKDGKRSFDFVPTPLLEAVADLPNSILTKKLVIIEEINLATASLIDAIVPLFDGCPTSKILQPNGTDVDKRDFYIVGIASEPIHYDQLTKNSIVFEKEDYEKQEFIYICSEILKPLKIDPKFISNFTKGLNSLRKVAKGSDKKVSISVRNCKMFNILYPIFMETKNLQDFLIDLTFNSPFIEKHEKFIKLQPHELKIEKMRYHIQIGDFVHQITDESDKQYDSIIQSLTNKEKELFLILEANTRKRFPIIVQGPTASGKTFTISLFAKIIGQKLTVLQLNSDTSVGSILGGYKPSKTIKRDKIISVLDLLEKCSPFFDNIIDELNSIENVTNTLLKGYINTIQAAIPSMKNENIIENANQAIDLINNASHIFNNIELADSAIVDAMVNGDWVLLDGIESAPPDIIERIITLLSTNPSLNLYEKGSDYIYSSNPQKNEKMIHPNFRIILTYNPIGSHKKTQLSSSALSRCVVFSMDEIDNSISSSALLIYYNLHNKNYPDFQSKGALSLQVANFHIKQKQRKADDEIKITGRNLVHFCKAINACNQIDIDQQYIKTILKDNYDIDVTETFDENDELLEDFNSEIQDIDKEQFNEHIKQTTFQIQNFKTCLNNLIQYYNYGDFFDILMKMPFIQYSNVKSLLQEAIDQLRKEIPNSPDFKHENVYVHQVLHEIILVYDAIDKLNIEFNDENCFYSSQIPKLSNYGFRLGYIQKISLSQLDKKIPSFITNYSNFEDAVFIPKSIKKELIKHIQILAFISEIDFSQYLYPGFREIYQSYKLCINENNNRFVNEIDQFFVVMKNILEKNPNFNYSPLDIPELLPLELSCSTDTLKTFLENSKELIKSSQQSIINDEHAENKFIIFAKDNIIKKRENYELYQELLDLFTKNKFNVEDNLFDELKSQIEQYSKGVSYDFTAHHQIESTKEQGDNPKWFYILARYNSIITSINNLSSNKKCFFAILRLSKEKLMDPGVFLPYFKGESFDIPKEVIDQAKTDAILQYIDEMSEENRDLIQPEKMKEYLDGFYFKTQNISSNWQEWINKTNQVLDINDQIIIPHYTFDHVKKFANNKFKEFDFMKCDYKSFREKIENIEGNENLKTLILDILIRKNYNEIIYHARDADTFDNNEIEYLNNNQLEGLFLALHPNIVRVLSPSFTHAGESNSKTKNKPFPITYGIFLLRLYSSTSLITFYTNNEKFTQEMKHSISSCLIEMYNNKKLDKDFSIIASFLLNNSTTTLEKQFKGSIFHNALIQIASYQTKDPNYYEVLNHYIGPFVKSLIESGIKNKWNLLLNGQNGFLLKPVESFIRGVNNIITIQNQTIKNEINQLNIKYDKEKDSIKTIINELIDATKN